MTTSHNADGEPVLEVASGIAAQPCSSRDSGDDLEADQADSGGTSQSLGPDKILLLTYRFLRFGILAAVATLIVSLVTEIIRTECVRNSISAYFYSPTRTVLTGSLMAVGLCLIVIQGDDDLEEVSLNLAGMLAPMIAVVPTRVSTKCDAAFAGLTDDDPIYLAMIQTIEEQTREGLHNNVIAYFGVLLAALVAVAIILPRSLIRDHNRTRRVRIAIALYIVVVAVFAYFASRTWNDRSSWAHNLSAISMFVFFGIVVAYNAKRERAPGWYRTACVIVAALMALTAVAVFPVLRWVIDVDWNVFVLEAVEIVLFAVFWILQTIAFLDRNPITGEEVAEPAESATDAQHAALGTT